METRNVLLAVILSTIILVFWATFFEAPIIEQQAPEEQITKKQDDSSPSIDEGAIGSGMDNFLTPLIDEGPIGLNFINPYSSGIGSNSFGGSLWD